MNKIGTNESTLINNVNSNFDKRWDIYIVYHKTLILRLFFPFLGSPLLLLPPHSVAVPWSLSSALSTSHIKYIMNTLIQPGNLGDLLDTPFS